MNAPRSANEHLNPPQSFRARTRTRPLRVVSPDIVRAAIARAVRGQSTSASLGSLTLFPHQQDAVSRLRIILKDLRVALLADDVGHGKTYVALAVAREYARVHIIAPAALLSMWRTAVARTQTANAELQSVQSYSRKSATDSPQEATGECVPNTPARASRMLFIIDEAHHLRTQNTRRFRAVANAVSGHDVLLLSATPIHNSPQDLRSLLALALGARADRLSAALLSRVIVRRSQNVGSPTVTEHPPTPIPHDPAILNAILALPSPLPAHDGAVAGALIRMGLLRAWCSSDAALVHALRQRVLRGEALRQALLADRHPTASEMRSWLVGDHEVQLAFPELMAQHSAIGGPLLEVLDTHVRAVEQIIVDHRMGINGDHARARILKDLLTTHPGTPIIAFSQFAETVRAISRALSDIAGVGALTGQRAWIASGVITRAEALDHFAPIAQGKPPPRDHQRIRLLVTTDLLAEGVNLQDAGVVVHLDLPWTDALRAQRVGRCARLGSPHHTVHVYTIAPHVSAEAVLRVYDRLERKARGATRLVGAPNRLRSLPTQAPSAADIATDVHRVVATWACKTDAAWTTQDKRARDALTRERGHACLAAVAAPVNGFIAVVSVRDMSRHWQRFIVCGRAMHRTAAPPRWTIGANTRLLHALVAHATPSDLLEHSKPSSPLHREEKDRITRHIRLWARRRYARSIIGLHADASQDEQDALPSLVHTKAHATILRSVAHLSTSARTRERSYILGASEMINTVRGAGAERALAQWLALRRTMTFREWLEHWKSFAVLARVVQPAHPVRDEHREAPALHIHCILALIQP